MFNKFSVQCLVFVFMLFISGCGSNDKSEQQKNQNGGSVNSGHWSSSDYQEELSNCHSEQKVSSGDPLVAYCTCLVNFYSERTESRADHLNRVKNSLGYSLEVLSMSLSCMSVITPKINPQ